MATAVMSIEIKQVLGTLLVELLTDALSEETINAVDQISRDDVPEVFSDIVGSMHGMSVQPYMRNVVVSHLLREVGGSAFELADVIGKRPFQPPTP
jgi:hypothetical protein